MLLNGLIGMKKAFCRRFISCLLLKHREKDDSDFMTVFYDTDRWHQGVAERAAEGARNHGLLNISADDFFDIDTTMPEDKVEQEKIGRLFEET